MWSAQRQRFRSIRIGKKEENIACMFADEMIVCSEYLKAKGKKPLPKDRL